MSQRSLCATRPRWGTGIVSGDMEPQRSRLSTTTVRPNTRTHTPKIHFHTQTTKANMAISLFLPAVMMIGFSTRSQTVSESEAPPGDDEFFRILNVTSLRTSEQGYLTVFRYQETSSTAKVEATNIQFSTDFDARFGTRETASDPIEDQRDLLPGNLVLSSGLPTSIVNDFRPESTECYTIRILSPDEDGIREVFLCNDDDVVDATDYFCRHTICILDDDGELTCTHRKFDYLYNTLGHFTL